MLKFLRDTWQEAGARVEAEDKARAEAETKPAAGRADDVSEEMLRLARAFASVTTASGLGLDFTPASLPAVDKLLARSRTFFAKHPTDERRQHEVAACVRMGAYVGEVLRRAEGGVWVKTSDDLSAVDLGSHVAPVVGVVVALFLQGRVDMPGGPVETLVQWYAAATTASRDSVETRARGRHQTLEDLQREMSDDHELSAWLTNQLQIAVKTAQVKWDISLDFTPASLEALERVLGQLHDMLKTATPEERPTDEKIQTQASIWGAYVGEVFRRHRGGKWSFSSEFGLHLVFEGKGGTIFPARKVWKRIVDGPGDAIPFYFHAVCNQLTRPTA